MNWVRDTISCVRQYAFCFCTKLQGEIEDTFILGIKTCVYSPNSK